MVQSQVLDVDASLLKSVYKQTGHGIAQRAASVPVAGIGSTKNRSSATLVYFLSLPPKISITWSQSKDSGGMTVICAADETKLQLLQDLFNQDFIQRSSNHPMIPALIVAILFSTEIDKTHEALKQEIRRVEVRTGHHAWRSRTEEPALGDLIGLAAKMSGCSTRAASCLRKQHTLSEILNSMLEHCDDRSTGDEAMIDMIQTLRTRATAQQIDTEFIRHRNQIQLEALYHLVAENDAFSVQEMAQDTKFIAAASQRDSTSMKCIALLTMFFLPGMFVSSLLSIPLFDWNADTQSKIFRPSYSTPILYAFAAITLPTMAVVFSIWGTWTFWQTMVERKRIVDVNAQLLNQLSANEVRLLASKRRSLSSQTKQ